MRQQLCPADQDSIFKGGSEAHQGTTWQEGLRQEKQEEGSALCPGRRESCLYMTPTGLGLTVSIFAAGDGAGVTLLLWLKRRPRVLSCTFAMFCSRSTPMFTFRHISYY